MSRVKKFILNPEYVEDQKRRRYETSFAMGSHDYPAEDRWPDEYGKKLPDDGGWIIIRRKINDATTFHITVPHLLVWFATPTMVNHSDLHQAIIQTPDGAVHVWPHEYQLFDIEKFLQFTDEDGFRIQFLSESSGFDEAALFYIRSRGISKADAQRMLLPSLKDPNYCWFQFAEEFREFFPSGTGTLYLHAINRERRAFARSRRTA